MSGFLGTTGQRDVDVNENNGLITLTPTEPAITERIRQAVDQSIEIIQRRVNELGLVEPSIQREGADRILVQVPGLQDPTRLKEILGKTAKLDFRMVDLSMTPEQAAATHPPGGFRNSRRPAARREISHREAHPGLRRRSRRRPGRLRSADQSAGRQFPLQFVGRAEIRRRDAGQCRQAVRHRARQQGDLRAGDPRADPRRLRARFPAISPSSRPTISPSCCAPARCRRR